MGIAGDFYDHIRFRRIRQDAALSSVVVFKVDNGGVCLTFRVVKLFRRGFVNLFQVKNNIVNQNQNAGVYLTIRIV